MTSEHAHHWGLDPSIAFLNHGSYGATPWAVLEAQQAWRERMERQPVQFLGREARPALDVARGEVASFLGCAPADLVFVQNATMGVNTILRWLKLEPGDELLTTNHAYGACKNAMDATAAWTGAKVVVADVPFPLEGEGDVVDAILGAVTARTRVAMLDHVTSPTALVFPIERLIRELAARGVETLVDGAHAPGMVDLDIGALGPAWYTGNGHKWLCSPKGAGFLYVRRDLQPSTRPIVISHGATQPLEEGVSRFQKEFQWTGTQDPTPWLCLPASIECVGAMLPGGWPAVRERNHALAVEAQVLLCEALSVPPPCPPEMLGSMAGVILPDAARSAQALGWDRQQWHDALLARGFEVPISDFPPGRLTLRVSCQLYNEREEYERLAAVVAGLLGR
jgi:isopenicillin-N epimerase